MMLPGHWVYFCSSQSNLKPCWPFWKEKMSVSLPTSYGKSIIYAMLPAVFDKHKGNVKDIISVVIYSDKSIYEFCRCIVVCVSPPHNNNDAPESKI